MGMQEEPQNTDKNTNNKNGKGQKECQLIENINTNITILEEIEINNKTYYKLELNKDGKIKQMYVEKNNFNKIKERDFIFDKVELLNGRKTTVGSKPIYKGIIEDMDELENKYFKGKGEGFFLIGQDIGKLDGMKNILPNKIGGIQILKGKVFAYAEIHGTSQENHRILGSFYEIGKPIIYDNFYPDVQNLQYDNSTKKFYIVYRLINTNFTKPLIGV